MVNISLIFFVHELEGSYFILRLFDRQRMNIHIPCERYGIYLINVLSSMRVMRHA